MVSIQRPPEQPPSEAPIRAPPQSERAPLVEASDSSSKKRKRELPREHDPRETLQETTVYRPYVSPYQPAMPANCIETNLPHTPTTYSVPNTLPPINHIYQRPQNIQTPRNETIRSHYRPIAAALVPQAMVLQSSASQLPAPRQTSFSRGHNGVVQREPSDSLSPSAQLLQSQQFQGHERLVDNQSNTPRFNAINNSYLNPPSTPLINTFPPKKQKEISGVIADLQSGIKSCQQQAEKMQKQLNMLQSALGMGNADDTEDEKGGT
jgi:hypothetical protein